MKLPEKTLSWKIGHFPHFPTQSYPTRYLKIATGLMFTFVKLDNSEVMNLFKNQFLLYR